MNWKMETQGRVLHLRSGKCNKNGFINLLFVDIYFLMLSNTTPTSTGLPRFFLTLQD